MKTSSKDILTNIIKIRNDKGLTQAAVAESIEVDYSSYSKLESGITKLSIDRLEKIASSFDMEIIDILTYPHKYVPAAPQETTKLPKVLVQIELEDSQKAEALKLVLGDKKASLLLNE